MTGKVDKRTALERARNVFGGVGFWGVTKYETFPIKDWEPIVTEDPDDIDSTTERHEGAVAETTGNASEGLS